MSVNWQWKPRPGAAQEISRATVYDFIEVVEGGINNPLILDRLNMFFESDPLILIRIRENPTYRGRIGLVSQDKKLAKKLVNYVRSNRDRTCVVYLIHPAIFFCGRIEEITLNCLIEDAGSLNFFGRESASSNLHEVNCSEIVTIPEKRYPGVVSVLLKGFTFDEKISKRQFRNLSRVTDEKTLELAREVAAIRNRISDHVRNLRPLPMEDIYRSMELGIPVPDFHATSVGSTSTSELLVELSNHVDSVVSHTVNNGGTRMRGLASAIHDFFEFADQTRKAGAPLRVVQEYVSLAISIQQTKLVELGLDSSPPPYSA